MNPQEMELPSESYCLNLYNDYAVMQNIRAHCIFVKEVAHDISLSIKNNGHKINIDLVDRLSLLHDVFKAATLNYMQLTYDQTLKPSLKELYYWITLKEEYSGHHETEIIARIMKEMVFLALLIHSDCLDQLQIPYILT